MKEKLKQEENSDSDKEEDEDLLADHDALGPILEKIDEEVKTEEEDDPLDKAPLPIPTTKEAYL